MLASLKAGIYYTASVLNPYSTPDSQLKVHPVTVWTELFEGPLFIQTGARIPEQDDPQRCLDIFTLVV